MNAKTMSQGEANVRSALTALADRYEEIAERAEHDRGAAYRRAADDIREVLRSGHIPHTLMTDAELDQHGAR